MRLSPNVSTLSKGKLSNTLKGFLGFLKAPITDLEEMIEEFKKDNPIVEIDTSGFKDRNKNRELFEGRTSKNSNADTIEKLTVSKESLYDKLISQIDAPLFPTPISVNIAMLIIEDINNLGYFSGDISDIANRTSSSNEMVEKIRKRFSSLDPSGLGALDFKESFIFQLEALIDELSDRLYKTTKEMILNIENIHKLKHLPYYIEATKIIKKFNNPPSIEYMDDDIPVIPDLIVTISDKIEIDINNTYYPSIKIDTQGLGKLAEESFIKNQVKNANDLITAIGMRRSTLIKVGTSLIDHQYDFFYGGDIKPMRLKDIAQELEYNPSTISRAIAGKYIECNRGIISLKSFFTTGLDEDLEISSTSIKNYIKEVIGQENRNKPLSDLKILQKVEIKFKIKIVRRTITKYRQSLGIGSSSDRRKYI